MKINQRRPPKYSSELFDAIRKFLKFHSIERLNVISFLKALSKAIYIDALVRFILKEDLDRGPIIKKLIDASFNEDLVNDGSEPQNIDTVFGEQLIKIMLNDKEFKAASQEKPDKNILIEKLVNIAFKNKLLENVFEQKQLSILLEDKPDRDEFKKIVEDEFKNILVNSIIANDYKKNDILNVYEIIKKHDTEKDRLEMERLLFEKPLIAPPGLHQVILDFEAHFAVSGDDPIMILGPTGVGKSLFLYLARILFKKNHQYDETPPIILEANCAHFSSGGSGYSLARSELFGHVKGAFTDAHKDKVGLVEKANGGLLILEEVGELPLEVQAMLLTFIETGEYRRLGDEEVRNATVKIVAATNRESALRADFRYRFFPYYIPPLRERKNDILYYFYEIFPELTRNLSKSEVLLLLTHHWPGNVREIERIGRLLNRKNYIHERIIKDNSSDNMKPQDKRIFHLDPRDTTFDPRILEKFTRDLKTFNVDISFLEKLLQKHRVSINGETNQKAFEELSTKSSGYFSAFDQYTLRFCPEFSPFNEAYEGYRLFCDLFLQDPSKDDNILATIKNQCIVKSFDIMLSSFSDKPSYQKRLKVLRRQIMKYLMDFSSTEYDYIDSPWVFWRTLEEKHITPLKDHFNMDFETEEMLSAISEYKEVELLKLYYQKQLEKTGGNIKAAANSVGLKENTFRSRIRKLGMAAGLNKK